MPSSAGRPWRMFLPLAAVVLLALAWTGYWLLASGILRSHFAEERSRLAARGLTLACAGESWGGYPFHFKFACGSPVLRFAGLAEVRSSELLLTALAYAPWQIVALVDGPSSVSGAGLQPAVTEHQRAMAVFAITREPKVTMSVEIPALSIRGRGGAAQLMLHTRPSSEGIVDIAASAQGISLQPPGRTTVRIAEGEIRGTLLPGRSFKIDGFSMQENAVRYWGNGSLTLGDTNRLSGTLETQTNDLDGLLTILTPFLPLTDNEKHGLRALLGLLGNEAKAPLIARDGVFYLGPFKLFGPEPGTAN